MMDWKRLIEDERLRAEQEFAEIQRAGKGDVFDCEIRRRRMANAVEDYRRLSGLGNITGIRYDPRQGEVKFYFGEKK